MAYEVIARKWRPQTFDEMVGQEAITRTLRNAVEQERLHHAYLFTGARGVGKTTSARILAKALNCAQGVTATPCGRCSSCTEIASGGSLDVLEIDAASHTGVDNIRDTIIMSVGIAPARDRYKVFIIDEVHQLSGAAFNALLKTLEEPPSRVVFVLATTELHKVPDTIVSRCQLFEFRSIPLSKVQTRLGEIVAAMGVSATPAALAAIARAGEGSMRDAQSALDQVIAFSGDRIDTAEVSTALGIVGDETLYAFLDAISRGDAAETLRLSNRLVETGNDLRHFTRGMMRAVRNLLVARAVGYDAELIDAAESDAERIHLLSQRFTETELVRAFSQLTLLEQEIRQSADPRFQLEMGMVRLAQLPHLRPLDDIIERLERLESRIAGESAAPSKPARPAAPTPPPAPPRREPPPPPAERLAQATSVEPPAPVPFIRPADPAPPRPAPVAAPDPPPKAEPPSKPEALLEPIVLPSPHYADMAESAPEPPPEPPPVPEPQELLDGQRAIEAIFEKLAEQKMHLALAKLKQAAEIHIDGKQLTIRFGPESAALTQTINQLKTRSSIEDIARTVTGRNVHVKAITSGDPLSSDPGVPSEPVPAPEPVAVAAVEAPAPTTSRPKPAPEPPPQAAAESPAPAQKPAPADASSQAEEHPVVQAMLFTFRGQLLGVDPPGEQDAEDQKPKPPGT